MIIEIDEVVQIYQQFSSEKSSGVQAEFTHLFLIFVDFQRRKMITKRSFSPAVSGICVSFSQGPIFSI